MRSVLFDGREFAAGVGHGDGLGACAGAELGGPTAKQGAGGLFGDAEALPDLAGRRALGHAAERFALTRAQRAMATTFEAAARLGEAGVAVGRAGADVVQCPNQLIEWCGPRDGTADALIEGGSDLAKIVALGVQDDRDAGRSGDLSTEPTGGCVSTRAHESQVETDMSMEIGCRLDGTRSSSDLEVGGPQGVRESFARPGLVVDQNQHDPHHHRAQVDAPQDMGVLASANVRQVNQCADAP